MGLERLLLLQELSDLGIHCNFFGEASKTNKIYTNKRDNYILCYVSKGDSVACLFTIASAMVIYASTLPWKPACF